MANIVKTGEPQQVPVGTVGIAIWMGSADAPPVLVYNQDSVNPVSLNYKTSVFPGAPNAIPLGPMASVVMDGGRTIYAAAPAGTQPIVVIPGATAYFASTILQLASIPVIFVQPTTPSASQIPQFSIWIQVTPGQSAIGFFTYVGSSWVQILWTAPDLLTPATITAALMAAGIVVPGIVNGTTLANLVAASIASGGTLGFLNAGGNATMSNDGAGAIEYVDASDGNTYLTGETTLFLAADFSVVSTTPTLITGMSIAVSARRYRVSGWLRGVAGASGANQGIAIQLRGGSGATASTVGVAVNTINETQQNPNNLGYLTALSQTPAIVMANVGNGAVFDIYFDGHITFSAGGTLQIFVLETVLSADEGFTVQSSGRSWMKIRPA